MELWDQILKLVTVFAYFKKVHFKEWLTSEKSEILIYFILSLQYYGWGMLIETKVKSQYIL